MMKIWCLEYGDKSAGMLFNTLLFKNKPTYEDAKRVIVHRNKRTTSIEEALKRAIAIEGYKECGNVYFSLYKKNVVEN